MVTTRPATADDKEFSRRLHRAASRGVVEKQFGTWDEADKGARFDKSLTVEGTRIIELGGSPVGSIASMEADGHVFLSSIRLLPAYKIRGICSELLRLEIALALSL